MKIIIDTGRTKFEICSGDVGTEKCHIHTDSPHLRRFQHRALMQASGEYPGNREETMDILVEAIHCLSELARSR